MAASAVAKGWSANFVALLTLMGIPPPMVIVTAPLTSSWGLSGGVIDLPAVVVTASITWVLLRGIKESSRLNDVMVVVKVSIVLFVIVVGAFYINPSNYAPFAPFGYAGISLFGWTVFGQADANGNAVGVLAGAGIVFFAFVGYDSVSCQAEECVDPQSDVPKGLLGSLAISLALYVAISLVLVGMVPYSMIDTGAPFSTAFKYVGLPWAEGIVVLGALAGITSVLLTTMLGPLVPLTRRCSNTSALASSPHRSPSWLSVVLFRCVGQPRITLAMARDGLLPPSFFAFIHPVYKTPYYATTLTGVVVAVTSGLIPLSTLVELVSIGTLFAFTLVSVCVIVLRHTKPDLPRPFRVPYAPYVPALGAFMCFMLMLSLPSTNWLRLFVWLAVGLVVYCAYGRKGGRNGHYRLGRGEENGEEGGEEADRGEPERAEADVDGDEGGAMKKELGSVRRILHTTMVEMTDLIAHKSTRTVPREDGAPDEEEDGGDALETDALAETSAVRSEEDGENKESDTPPANGDDVEIESKSTQEVDQHERAIPSPLRLLARRTVQEEDIVNERPP